MALVAALDAVARRRCYARELVRLVHISLYILLLLLLLPQLRAELQRRLHEHVPVFDI